MKKIKNQKKKKKLSNRDRKKLKQELKEAGNIITVPQTNLLLEDEEENKAKTIDIPFTTENVFLTGTLPFAPPLSDDEEK